MLNLTVIVAAMFLLGGNAPTLAQTQGSETVLAQQTKQVKERQSRIWKTGRREEARERARLKWLLEEDRRKAAAKRRKVERAKKAKQNRRKAEAARKAAATKRAEEARRVKEEARQAEAARMAEAAKKAEERRRNAEAKRRVTQSAVLPPGATRILFAKASTKLSVSAKGKLEPMVNRMISHADARLVIFAYAAGDGTDASDARRLSLSRALAVQRFLKARGMPGTRIDIQTLGDRAGSAPSNRLDLVLVRR